MCNCTKKRRVRYVWTSDDGESTATYYRRAAVEAKIKRAGGTYEDEVY